MLENTLDGDLPIIEVPPELRGLSDEEIILSSETNARKELNKNNRPSKKERQAKKIAEAQKKMAAIAEKMREEREGKISSNARISSIPMPKLSDFEIDSENKIRMKAIPENKKNPLDELKNLFTEKFAPGSFSKKKESIVVHSSLSEAPKPTSGRVLKGAFGMFGKKASATIVNADEWKKNKELEREAKIKKVLKTSLRLEKTIDESKEETKIKRKRGRPRKNPLIETAGENTKNALEN